MLDIKFSNISLQVVLMNILDQVFLSWLQYTASCHILLSKYLSSGALKSVILIRRRISCMKTLIPSSMWLLMMRLIGLSKKRNTLTRDSAGEQNCHKFSKNTSKAKINSQRVSHTSTYMLTTFWETPSTRQHSCTFLLSTVIRLRDRSLSRMKTIKMKITFTKVILSKCYLRFPTCRKKQETNSNSTKRATSSWPKMGFLQD